MLLTFLTAILLHFLFLTVFVSPLQFCQPKEMLRKFHIDGYVVKGMRSSLASKRHSSQLTMSYETFLPKESSESPSHTIGFFHGILGSKKNWRTPAKAFLQQHSHYGAFTADWRGHGESHQLTRSASSNTLTDCAQDLNRLFHTSSFQQNFPAFQTPASSSLEGNMGLSIMNRPNIVLCAHSFGGKVLLEYIRLLMMTAKAQLTPSLPKIHFTTFILDSIPDLFDPEHDSFLHKHQSVDSIISMLLKAPKTYPTKEAAYKYLESTGQTKFVSQWLLMNLVPIMKDNTIEAWKYSFDIDGIATLFASFRQTSYWEVLEQFNQDPLQQQDPESQGKIVFVRAGKNPFWKHNAVDQRLQEVCKNNPSIHFVTMPHVGHWLHSEDLLGLLKVMEPYLPK